MDTSSNIFAYSASRCISSNLPKHPSSNLPKRLAQLNASVKVWDWYLYYISFENKFKAWTTKESLDKVSKHCYIIDYPFHKISGKSKSKIAKNFSNTSEAAVVKYMSRSKSVKHFMCKTIKFIHFAILKFRVAPAPPYLAPNENFLKILSF